VTVGPVPKLGVGLNYQESLRPFLQQADLPIDYLEVVPDIVWTDRGPEHKPRYVEDPEVAAFVARMRKRLPVVAHSIGLSIGSAHDFKQDHVDELARWHDWLGFPWHSDHLAFNIADLEQDEVFVGVPLPLPLDRDTLGLVAERVAVVQHSVPVPFALENNVSFFRYPNEDFDEPEFLNLLCGHADCWLLLDLHNLYVNHRNNGVDPVAFLQRLDLDRVIEIHLAGGMEYDGFYLDGHSGPTPEAVWSLAESVVPRCRNLGGITFELVGSWLPKMGEELLAAELARMGDLWRRHQPVGVPVSDVPRTAPPR
jgi:uncharacterized protein